MTNTIWIFVVGVVVFSVVLTWASWAGVLWLTARGSGWGELAAQYGRAFPDNSAPRLLRQFGVGRSRPYMYNRAIRACIQNRSLHLSPTALAKISHNDIAIPLENLDFQTEQPEDKKMRCAKVMDVPDRKVWLTQEEAEWIITAQESA